MIEADGVAAKYWPRWRGPSGQGLVPDGPYPDRWSANQNSSGAAPVAGRGNSSPIVWGDRIFLTTAHDGGQRLSLVCFRRADGKQLWETFVPEQRLERGHPKNGHASATPVTDGRRVYASFGSNGLLGRRFRRQAGVASRRSAALANYHGSAGSPVLYKDRVFIYQDHGGSEAAARSSPPSRPKPASRCGGRRATRDVGWGTPVVITRRRPRRADRQQPAARARLRSGDRQGAVVRRRQHF